MSYGSHIRTLLLTFFRQMPELIERGHIYIAQPPLYKVKKGKNEQYIKDDEAMDEYILGLSLDNAALYPSSDSPAIKSTALEELARNYTRAQQAIQRLSIHYPSEVIDQITQIKPLKPLELKDESIINQWVASLQSKFDTLPNQKVINLLLQFKSKRQQKTQTTSLLASPVHFMV